MAANDFAHPLLVLDATQEEHLPHETAVAALLAAGASPRMLETVRLRPLARG